MHPRFEDDCQPRGDRPGATPIRRPRHESRSERVREIRLRIADDAYRSAEVVDVIARRLLMGREL